MNLMDTSSGGKVFQKQQSSSQFEFSANSTLEHELEGHLILRKVFQKQQPCRVLRLFNHRIGTRRTPYLEGSIPEAAVSSSFRLFNLRTEVEGHLILRKVSQQQQSGRVLCLFNHRIGTRRTPYLEGSIQKQQSVRVLRLFNLRTGSRRTPHLEESIPAAAVRSSSPPIQP
ncbi:hypothetical protein CEXT_55961 [Caerostris extrusa]|uniref:Uncharacterized protein n=1 Tax=Caerostris extrusa TaxID=172846 RepID=A0AAV4WRI1_CAEEX|nr:hypothetical protein CEXT_55961 [Caerostris extrusa]